MKLPQGSVPDGPSSQAPSTAGRPAQGLSQGLSLRIGFWVVLLLGTFAWAPATYPGYWQALEGFTPVFNAVRPSSLAAAVPADLWRGAGGASYLLVRPLLLTGLDATTAVRIGFILYIILGGLGVYVWLQQRLGDRAAGLAGLLYMLAPPLLATVYIRGSLSDLTIVALLPLALAGLTSYCDSRSLSAVGIGVIAIWWMWQAQAGLALFASLFLLLYMLSVERSWVAVLIVALSSAAGLTSLAGLFDSLGLTGNFAGNSPSPFPVDFTEHFVYFFQLFTTGWQRAPSIAGWLDHYPFQLGTALVIFSLLTLWLWLSTRKQQTLLVNRLFAFSFVGSVVLLLLSTPMSALLWQWSQGSRLLTYPWQLLLLALPLLVVTAGGIVALHPVLRQTPYWLTVLVLTLFSSAPYLKADYTQFTPPAAPLAFFGTHNEIVVLRLALTENRQPRSAEIAVTWQTRQPLTADYNIFFQALRTEASAARSDASPTPDNGQPLAVVGQLDQQPFGGIRPATSWEIGTIYTDTYQLDLADVASNITGNITGDDELIYYFGYYNWDNGVRLPVNGGIDDKLIFYGE